MLVERVRIACLSIHSSSSAYREGTYLKTPKHTGHSRERIGPCLYKSQGRRGRNRESYKWQRIREIQGPERDGADFPEDCKTVAAEQKEEACEVSRGGQCQ